MGIKDDVYARLVSETIAPSLVDEVALERVYAKPEILEYLDKNNYKFCKYDSLGFDLLTELDVIGWVSDLTEFTLKNRIVVPIRNAKGEILTLVGWKKGASKYYTIPSDDFSKETHWFNLDRALQKSFSADSLLPNTCVVVEGIFDALMLDALGIPCVATMGADVGEMKGKVLMFFDKVICIPDNDKVGRNAFQAKRWKVPSNSSFVYFNEKTLDLGDGIFKKIKDVDDIVNWLDSSSLIALLQQVAGVSDGSVYYFDL